MNRIYNNTEIQKLLAERAKSLSKEELELFCTKEYSKSVFGINYSLFVKISSNSSSDQLDSIIKDKNGYSRWTWKYKFEVDGFLIQIFH